MDAGNLMTSSPGDSLRVRIISPELDFQTLLVFSPDDTAWQAKQKVISTACPDRKDVLNFGLYCPSVNNRAGKFLDEERPLRDYPMPGPIGLLEFKYKKRVYKTQFNPTKLKKLHSLSNLKKFMDYVYKANADKVTEMTNKGLDPNFYDSDKGETPMTVAANLPRPRSVMLALMSGGAYLDFRNRKGLTALHVAAEAGNRDAIKMLLDLGASPNYKDGQGLTPLFYCVAKGNGMAQCIQMLLHDRAEICNRDENGWTEIHHACMHGKVQHLEHLLFYGADMNAKTSSGDTALHICARYNEEECGRALLFRGADKTLKNASDEDAVTMARLAGHTKLADIISSFRPEDIVLYTELPKYNDKRRGTISMATIRNLQRSRSNPQLHKLFLQDGNYAASLSSAGGYQVLSNSFVFGNAKHQGEPAQGHVIPADPFPHSSAQLQSESEPRMLVLRKEQTGFGFILRGAKSRSGTGTERLNFKPTPNCPALQYFDNVEKGSVAERAGLLSGDYLLEVNGENVISASHDYTVSLIKNSGNQVTLKVVTAKRRPKENGEPVNSTSGAVVAKISAASLSPSIGSQMRSSLAGLEELERLDASLDEYENETASASAVPIYSTVYRERRSESQNQPPISEYRSTIYVNQSSIDSNLSADHVNGANGFASAQDSVDGHSSVNGVYRPRSALLGHAEPEPDYDDGPVAEEVETKEDTEDLGSSSFALLIKQATLNRERRLKERERLDAVVVGTKQEMAPPVASANRNGSVPPPPPPPPPIASSGVPDQSYHRSGSDSGRPVPPEVKKHLDENKKRDEAHAALMAAVLKRRNLLESTEEAQVADSIENRLQKSRKVQVIYRGDHIKEELTSPTKSRPNSLYHSSETNGSLGRSSSVNGSGMLPENSSAGMGVAVHATTTENPSIRTPKKTVPQTSSKPRPNGSVGASSGDLVLLLARKGIHRQLSNEQEPATTEVPLKIVPGSTDAIKTQKQTVWTNEQTHTPAPVNHNVTSQTYGSSGNGYPRTDVTRYSDRYVNEDAASTISTLSTLSTLSSLSPENPSSAGSSPPQHQSSYMSKANARNQLHSKIDLSQIPEGIVGVMIPPPAEFLGDEPSTTNQKYNALPVTATLRTVNKAPLGNSMVFPALIKDNKAAGNSSFAEKALESWSVGDVGEWLDGLDYGFYQERFAEMNINGERLAQLDENDMQVLGVEKVLHRIKLVREVRKLLKGPGMRLS